MQSFCVAIVCKLWHRHKTETKLYWLKLFNLFIKHLSLKCRLTNKQIAQLHCSPGEKHCIHSSLNPWVLWEAEQGYLSSQPTTHFFRNRCDVTKPCEIIGLLQFDTCFKSLVQNKWFAKVSKTHEALLQKHPLFLINRSHLAPHLGFSFVSHKILLWVEMCIYGLWAC